MGRGRATDRTYRYRPLTLTMTRLAVDTVCVTIAVLLAVFLRFRLGLLEVTESGVLTIRAHVVASFIWVLTMIGTLALNRLYDEDTLFPGGGEQARIVHSVVEAIAALSTLVLVTQSFYVSRSWFGLTALLTTGLVMGGRTLLRRGIRTRREQGRSRRQAILIAQEPDSWEEWPEELAGEFDVIAHLKPTDFTRFVATQSNAHPGMVVILRARDFTSDEFWSILIQAGECGWSVFVRSPVRSVARDRLTVRELGGQTIVKVAPPRLSGVRAAQKRTLDVLGSATLFILLSPVLAALALALVLSSGWPVIYRQERVGLRGKTFPMYKFRTMKRDAEVGTGPVWASADDPRRTPIGRALRRTSLDELPQLWNVLKGDMSLIGPRPERPGFVDEFTKSLPWYRFRHRIRPGITGWAQAHGLRGNTEMDSRIESDNWYIENWSIWLDLKILGATFVEIFRGRNAY